MGAILLEIINNRVIQAAALAWAIAQGIKVLLTLAISRRFDYTRVFGSGGMPSSHSSMACAMLMVVGLHEGFSSAVFALAFCFAGVTMYDAAGVRRSTGRNAAVINHIVEGLSGKGFNFDDEHLKELVGHTPIQVLAGALLGILVGIAAALIMNKTVFRGKPVPFVMELPNYRMPSLKSVALLLWEKARDFLQRAFTVIFLATIIIWFLQSFDTRLNVVADSSASLLALIGRWIAPLFAPLGFADWRCATALISGLIAKESVVSTLEVLLGGAAISSMLSTRAAIGFLVFTLLYTPCVAAMATIRRELNSTVKTAGVVLMQCAVAWCAAFIAYAAAGGFV